MRIAQHELHEIAFDRDRLVLEVGRCERMMGERLCADGERDDSQGRDEITLHKQSSCTTAREI